MLDGDTESESVTKDEGGWDEEMEERRARGAAASAAGRFASSGEESEG